MKKTSLKKLPIILGSAAVIFAGIAFACSDFDWDERDGSSFTPEAFVSKKYTPFFFSNQFYYDIGFDNEQAIRFSESNINDWKSYLGNEATKEGLDYLLNTAELDIINQIDKYLNDAAQTFPSEASIYSFLKNKSDAKLKNFIQYLAFAKEAEGYAYTSPDYWDDGTSKGINTAPYRHLESKFTTGFQSTDAFIKQRYWFQLVRFYFFNKQYKSSIDFFNKNKNTFDKNTLYYRTMSYAAGAYYKQKNYSEANYLYSIVFANCDALKTTAHFSFHPQEESDWNATLALATKPEEKIVLWQMLGTFYDDELRSIKEIYKLDPTSESLDLLLARAVNKAETAPNALTNEVNNLLTEHKLQPALLKFVESVSPSKMHNPFLWSAATGYLNMLFGNFNKVEAHLNQAAAVSDNSDLQKWQLRLLQVLNKVAATPTIDESFENNILNDLTWLKSFGDSNSDIVFRYQSAFEFIKNNLALKYQKQGDVVKSELFADDLNFFNNNADIEKLKSFLHKTNKSAYEKIAASLFVYNLSDLYEFQAVKATHENKIDEAIDLMQHASIGGQTKLLANPFNGYIKDCHDCEHNSFKGTALTKLAFLQKIKDMQAKISAGTDVYDNALLLANGFYNISHYGNARKFTESSIVSVAFSPAYLEANYKPMLTNMDNAKQYYQMALNAAINDEQRAKCTYMLAKCERNEWYNKHIYFNANYEQYDFGYDGKLKISDMKLLKDLKLKYAHTKYYKEVIRECGYISKR